MSLRVKVELILFIVLGVVVGLTYVIQRSIILPSLNPVEEKIVIDDLARERIGEVLFAKLDTDANPVASQRFGIRGIPTLILFSGGAEVSRQTGAIAKEQLEVLIASAA